MPDDRRPTINDAEGWEDLPHPSYCNLPADHEGRCAFVKPEPDGLHDCAWAHQARQLEAERDEALAEVERLRDILKRLVDAEYGMEMAPDSAIASTCLGLYRDAVDDARAALDGEERHGG